MFDISFLELLVVATVALLVLGPERLPGAVRTASLWLGRLRRSFNDIKRDIEREVGADDIKRQLHNEQILKSLQNTRKELDDGLRQAGEALERQSGLDELRSLRDELPYDLGSLGDHGDPGKEGVQKPPAPATTPTARSDGSRDE